MQIFVRIHFFLCLSLSYFFHCIRVYKLRVFFGWYLFPIHYWPYNLDSLHLLFENTFFIHFIWFSFGEQPREKNGLSMAILFICNGNSFNLRVIFWNFNSFDTALRVFAYFSFFIFSFHNFEWGFFIYS